MYTNNLLSKRYHKHIRKIGVLPKSWELARWNEAYKLVCRMTCEFYFNTTSDKEDAYNLQNRD